MLALAAGLMAGCAKEDPGAALKHATDLFNSHQFTQAQLAFANFINDYPKDSRMPTAWMLCADSLRAQGLIDPATAQYCQLLEKYPNTDTAVESQFRLAVSSLQVGRFNLAMQQLRQTQEMARQVYEGTRETEQLLRFKFQECNLLVDSASWTAAETAYQEYSELSGDPQGRLWSLSRQAYCAGMAGDVTRSLQLYDEFTQHALAQNLIAPPDLESVVAPVVRDAFGVIVNASAYAQGHAFFAGQITAATADSPMAKYARFYDAQLHNVEKHKSQAIEGFEKIHSDFPGTELGIWSYVELGRIYQNSATPSQPLILGASTSGDPNAGTAELYYSQALAAYDHIAKATDSHYRRRVWAYNMKSQVFSYMGDLPAALGVQQEIARRFYYDRNVVTQANQSIRAYESAIQAGSRTIAGASPPAALTP